jgi:hypothetical protein
VVAAVMPAAMMSAAVTATVTTKMSNACISHAK